MSFFSPAPSCGLTALSFLIAVSSAGAEDKILFLGNSFTLGGTANVPTIFDRLAIAGGQPDPTVEMRAVGGQGFQFHENDATSQAAIRSRAWTHVVLQNYSTEPTHIGNIQNHTVFGTLLYNRVIANNAATNVVLFETWSRAASHEYISGVSSPTTFASTDEMQSELRVNYRNLADSLNTTYPANLPVTIAPVGDAWEISGGMLEESHPDFCDLHGGDNYHGNDNGYFLTAATIYSRIYGKSAEGLHVHPSVASLNLVLTEDPVFLERVAWQTVSGTAPIQYSNHPASVTVAENQPATFSAKVRGSMPYTAQWYRNGSPIAGAESLRYTVSSPTSASSGSSYTVKVTNGASAIISNAAMLTVVADQVAPIASTPLLLSEDTISLLFSEAISPLAAEDPLSFTVVYRGQEVPVSLATLAPDGKTVFLSLGLPIQKGFVVGLSPSIKDLAGNPVASGSVLVSSSPSTSNSKLYFDFGANNTFTTTVDDLVNTWNNVGTTIAQTNTGTLGPLVDSHGAATQVRLEMIRRFNDANGNGTTTSTEFPASATRDSLYGNNEIFNGQANVAPAFKLTGLNPQATYTLTFYASRTGVADNRETLYTVTGTGVTTAKLNVANNVNATVTIASALPTAAGVLTIELSPTAQNNNANHFVYLGAMVVTSSSTEPPVLYQPVVVEGQIVVDWSGGGQLQSSPDLRAPWVPVGSATVPPYTEPLSGSSKFFRLFYITP